MTKDKDQGTEVAVSEGLALSEMGELFSLKDNMEGVVPEFPVIKTIHQGQMFELPDGSKVESFEGLVIDIARTNAYWHESFDTAGGGNPPDCFSMDGVVPSHSSPDKQSEDCATCPMNQFGSDPEGSRGKACKNMKRLFILLEGEKFPFRLVASPANIKSVDRYITQLSSKGVPYQLAVTEFSLSKVSNMDNIEYSGFEFKTVKLIDDPATAQTIKRTVTDLKGAMRGLEITAAEL